MHFDVVIIGGGAAGLLCAIEAGKRGRKVVVIERNEVVGRKIKISGGGRCNFTNIHCAPDNFISGNPNFHKSALSRYTPDDFLSLIRKHRIGFHEKKLGQLFCDDTSQSVIDMLLRECAAAHVEIRTGLNVLEVRKADRFLFKTNEGELSGSRLVIASGGLSIPKIGASDFGYRIAKQFGHRLTEVRPGLVPLTFTGIDGEMFRSLSGVSVEALVSFGKTQFRENVLFTHQGLSGPAILQISSYWKPGDSISLDLFDLDLLPKRLAQKWMERYGLPKPVAQSSRREIEEFEQRLHHWTLVPRGTEGYEKAEVTLGGVDTRELSSKTMESQIVPGLFFIGEVVDVTGQLGGFNFQWAWASGFVAGQAV